MAGSGVIPVCDLRRGALTVDHVRAYRRTGALVLRNVLDPGELAAVREETDALIDAALQPDVPWELERDVSRADGGDRSPGTPFRVEYPIDKSGAIRRLLGHPEVLSVVEALAGPNFVPTWDSLVFKLPRRGPEISWHRDAGRYEHGESHAGSGCVVDVGIYLDAARAPNCVWCLPGTNYWSQPEADAEIARRRASATFDLEGAEPLEARPGDVVMHNVLVLHGSPAVAEDQTRRVVYFEFRPAELERAYGPHTREYVALKQQVLLECLRQRAAAARNGAPSYAYRPLTPPPPAGAPPVLRVPHDEHWAWAEGP